MDSQNALIHDRYRLGRLLGGGAMGNVYAGSDTLTGEAVAIKQLRPELTTAAPDLVERFLREGEALRRLNHPNIVKVLNTVDEGNRHYIIMEYVGGGSLADLLLREPKLPLDRVVSIGLELSDALSRAHHLQILHRDIKPANILLAEDGTPRLTDFGLARMGEMPRLTETGTILGTLSYLSPEVFEGRAVNERSDIWSFGVVLFEMLAGRLPFNGDTAFDLMWAVKTHPLPMLENLRGGVPPALASLIRRMLRDASHRAYDPRQTLEHWHYVRSSEMRNIIPQINTTDFIINSAMPYELAIYASRLKQDFQKWMEEYQSDPLRKDAFTRAERVAKLLSWLTPVKDESLVPTDSVIREFIGGSTLKY